MRAPPLQLPGDGVYGIGRLISREVHGSVHDDGSGLKSEGLSGIEGRDGFKGFDVGGGDFLERRVTIALQIAVVSHPVGVRHF